MSGQNTRHQLRQQRKQLSAQQQSQAAQQLASHLTRTQTFQNSRRIAFYLANDGEIDPSQAMAIAAAAGKTCYLPVLHPLQFNQLYFARYRPGDTLQPNRFGIPEPSLKAAPRAPAWSLDLILLPLVAFDGAGNRMGMGGGFYDRTLAFTRQGAGPRPQLVGLAHSFQQVRTINAENWDIPLKYIITEHGVITTKQGL